MKHIIVSSALVLMTSTCARNQNSATIPAQQIGMEERHQARVALGAKTKFDLLMIGDSITHTLDNFGGKYAAHQAVWDRHFGSRHGLNLGYNGARTENILWNLKNGELDGQSPKVAVLLIGTNNADDRQFRSASAPEKPCSVNTPEEIFEGTKAIVDLIKQRCPKTKILVLRIFPRGGDGEQGAGSGIFHGSAKCIEAISRAGALTRQLADGKQVFWLDVGHVFLLPDGTINADRMPDLLHPNAVGAEAWAQAIEPVLAELMGDTPIAAKPANPEG